MKYLMFPTKTTIMRKVSIIIFLQNFPFFSYLHIILYVMVNKFLSSVTLSAVCCFMSGHLLFSSSSLCTPLCFVCCTLFNCYSVLWNLLWIAVQHTFTGKLQKTDSNEMQKELDKHSKYMGWKIDGMTVCLNMKWICRLK